MAKLLIFWIFYHVLFVPSVYMEPGCDCTGRLVGIHLKLSDVEAKIDQASNLKAQLDNLEKKVNKQDRALEEMEKKAEIDRQTIQNLTEANNNVKLKELEEKVARQDEIIKNLQERAESDHVTIKNLNALVATQVDKIAKAESDRLTNKNLKALVASHVDKIAQLENEIRSSRQGNSSVQNLQASLNAWKEIATSFSGKVSNLLEDNKVLDKELKRQNETIEGLVLSVYQNIRNIDQLNSRSRNMEARLIHHRVKLQGLENMRGGSGTRQETPVYAFYVRRNDDLVRQNATQRITYDEIILNRGGAWLPSNNSFVAPFKGIYVFHLHSLSTYSSGAWMYTQIRVNNVIVAQAWSAATVTPGTGLRTSQGDTAIAILHLEEYDVITTTLAKDYEMAGNRFSSFSGFLLA